jgi:GH35 family endo-1,4-beta-xylanase
MQTVRLLLVAIIVLFALTSSAEEIVITPTDTGEALVNPMMGWCLYFYSNIPTNYGSKLAPSDTMDEFPGISTIYLRLPWAYIEPQEGVYDWSIVDAPAQRWIDKGMKVALCFSSAESWLMYATPEWVKDAGAKGYYCAVGKGVVEDGPLWEPDYNDPIFLEKVDNFLTALAKRYDGNPNVAFVDVGSFGVWGEGHTFHTTGIQYPAEVVNKHIDLYAKHFKKTLLVANDDYSFQGDETVDYAREKGMTLRDNSILVQPPPNSWYHGEMAEAFWPRLPIILEHEHWQGSKDRGAWTSELFMQAIEEYHASYMSIHWFPREFLEGERELIDQVNQRLGYRLQLREARWPKTVGLKERVRFDSTWANVGVAPCYPGGFVAFTLKDAQDGIVAVFSNEAFDVRELEVAPPGEATTQATDSTHGFALNMPAGTFDVFVSVGQRDGTPVIALPLPDHDGHRRYKLGQVEVKE